MARSAAPAKLQRYNRLRVFQLVILGVALMVLRPQFSYLQSSVTLLQHIQWWWLAVAFWASFLSYVLAGYVYMFFVKKPLPVWPLMLVQAAASFTNRLLPSGLGNVTLNMQFMRRQGLSGPDATMMSLANQVLGFVAYVLVALTLLWVIRPDIGHAVRPGLEGWYVLAAVCAVLTTVYIFNLLTAGWRDRVRKFVHESWKASRALLRRPFNLSAALLASIGITLAYGFCLYAAVQATGADMVYAEALLIFVVAGAVGSAAPTPGGLGAVEAAVATSLTTAGLEPGAALLVTFVYRLASFWLPLLPGYLAFRYLTARKLV